MFIKGVVSEYDIKMCNISILRYKNIINNDEYDYYANLPKHKRNILLGLKRKDNEDWSSIIDIGTKEIHDIWISKNNITEDDIIEINHDAIWISGIKSIKVKNINGVEMVNKQSYTSRLVVNKTIFYFNSITGKTCHRYLNPEIFSDDIISLIYKILMFLEFDNMRACYTTIHDFMTSKELGVNEYDIMHEIINEINI